MDGFFGRKRRTAGDGSRWPLPNISGVAALDRTGRRELWPLEKFLMVVLGQKVKGQSLCWAIGPAFSGNTRVGPCPKEGALVTRK
jgi:hypothetical protein